MTATSARRAPGGTPRVRRFRRQRLAGILVPEGGVGPDPDLWLMHAGGRFATARGIDDAERLVLDDDTLLALLESPAAAVAPHGCFGWTGISFLVRRAELVSEYRRTGVPRRLPLASWEGGRAGSWLAAGNRLGTYWKRGIGQLRLPHQVP